MGRRAETSKLTSSNPLKPKTVNFELATKELFARMENAITSFRIVTIARGECMLDSKQNIGSKLAQWKLHDSN